MAKFVEFTVENNHLVWYHGRGFKKTGTYRKVHNLENRYREGNILIAIICLLIPPAILVCMREKVFKNHENIYKTAFSYAVSVLLLNGFMMAVLYYLFDNNGNVFSNLNKYNNFPCKYIALTLVIALAEPYVEKFIRENVKFDVKLPQRALHFQYSRVIASIYAVILFALNFVRIFDNNFGGDEAFTTNLVANTVPVIIQKTAADVHPPLYYLIVKIGYTLVGNQGWMFHLISLIPCAIILIFSLTAVWNRFGKETAIILMTLATLSKNAVAYNMEVRMYSWGALFVLLSFYSLYLIMDEESPKHYVLFALSSLAAAYTHYYCLVSVAFFYVVLLVLAFWVKRLNWKKVLGVCICTVIAYLPWIPIVLQSMLKRSDSYWITSIPTFKNSVKYLFSSQFSNVAWLCIGVVLVLAVLYETGILTTERTDEGKYRIGISFAKINFSTNLIWILAGIVSIIGTIGFGILISEIIRPFYTLRYIYPVSIVAWILLGMIISKLKTKKLVTIVLMVYMLVIFLPAYANTYTSEKASNDKLQTTLDATVDVIDTDDIILTNHSHISWTIASYYYPGVSSKQIDLTEIPDLDEDTCYWLIISGKQEMDDVYAQIEGQGFTWTQIVDGGNLGTHTVYIYQIVYDE